MQNYNYLSYWIKRFLLEYLISIKNLSKNTQHSYRDTFRLMLPFVAQIRKKSIDNLNVEDISPDTVKAFLMDMEATRHCSISTRNQRLAAIHALSKFIGINSPEHVEWCRQIQMIPPKKAVKKLITYLEKSEMNALLEAPDKTNAQGFRDYVLLLFMYNTGARADEVAQLLISDLSIADNPQNLSTVLIKGKGGKLRRCPLWQHTVIELKCILANRDKSEHVFLNRCKQPLTRFGIHTIVKKYVEKITLELPEIIKKQVSPHTIRHTTATHLLQSGVDINTIRAWLGHVSINTTNIYAEVDLAMKAKALATCEITNKAEPDNNKHWRDDKDLMDFLNKL